MRRIKEILQRSCTAIVVASMLAVGLPKNVVAETASAPSLVISQLKLTSSNGQFITLYNASQTAIDMSKYQLQYFNNYDLSKATSSKVISLSGIVPPHGYYMVNDGTLMLCYQLTIDSISLGLSTTAGMLELLVFDQSTAGGSAVPLLQDYVSWSKTAASGVQTPPSNINSFLQRQPIDTSHNPSISSAGAGSWQAVQPDPTNACKLLGESGSIQTGLSQLLPASEPPATILSLGSNEPAVTTTASIPAADIGLMAPKITELLPNPSGTGNDSVEEFIELYNPNTVRFDLSGFILQVGTTSLRTYVFPAGSSLSANSFKAFYSSTSGLSLSNTGSQAKLLDPMGNSIAITDIYSTAKDGQSWALANGKWYWTTRLTPSAANVINQPVVAKRASSKTSSSKSKSSKSTAATAKSASAPYAGQSDEASTTPIHPLALALVALAALIYGAYEYRSDLANRIFQLRSYVTSRRAGRTEP